MPQAYDSLAEWFEYLNDDCDYVSWSQYFIDTLHKFNAGREGLEMGCGSGAFCRALSNAGFLMTGADISIPMLQRAAQLARQEGLQIPFIQADAVRFKSPKKYDFVIAPNDCYNYIPQDKLLTAFRRALECLKKGGIFWVDVSSEYKFRTKIANNILADDRDDVTYLSFNKLYKDKVETDVTLFIHESDGKFVRKDERHVQYIHTEEEISSALDRAGFVLLAVEGHLGEEKAESDRLNLICRKI